jgi:nucleoside 2-deoxyribosyltransferase
MRAYIGIKFHPDNRNREHIEQLSDALTSCGFETVCVRRDVEEWGAVTLSPRELMKATFETIRSCQLVVIELTEKGVGLGIESGYAYAHAIPVITVARDGSDISDTLRGISQAVHLYGSVADLRELFMNLKM